MRKVLAWLAITSIISSGYLLQRNSSRARQKELEENTVGPPKQETTYQEIRGYNYNEGDGYKSYSDEEIRMLREKQSFKSEGSYIYTPGRHVPTREEEIERYLEDNPDLIEEIYEKYRD
ncbi:MAG: hypothetical protein CL596_05125 [Alteromonas sp.]|nr:hypothetical protein [Alteromonas sp.]|tara:strand:- start:19593 stop:19949 length:357 start_codon:yes stop_codon:yes gene_type:complete